MASITSRAIAAEAIRLADHTRHQTALRLLPFLFVLYVTNYLDRTSLAYAAIGMKRDLGFSDSVTGLGLGVFFISYVALQIPGAIFVELEPQLRKALADIDPNLTVISVQSMNEQVASNFDQQRMVARLAGTFGFIAMLLAAIGLYGSRPTRWPAEPAKSECAWLSEPTG